MMTIERQMAELWVQFLPSIDGRGKGFPFLTRALWRGCSYTLGSHLKHEKINSISQAAIYQFAYYINKVMTTSWMVSQRFPKSVLRFPKILQQLSEVYTIVSRHFRTLMKIIEISEEEPMTFRRHSNTSKYLCNHSRGDRITIT